MVVFVGLDALSRVVLVDGKLALHPVENVAIDGYWVNANLDAFEVALALGQFEPGMLANLLDGVPLLRIRVQNAVEEVLGFVGNVIWRLEVSRQDLLVQVGRVRVFERQEAAYECKQDDAARPNIHVGAVIFLTGNHLRRGITRRAARCLQQFSRLVRVGQAEVHDLDALVEVQQQVLRLEITMDYVEAGHVLYA